MSQRRSPAPGLAPPGLLFSFGPSLRSQTQPTHPAIINSGHVGWKPGRSMPSNDITSTLQALTRPATWSTHHNGLQHEPISLLSSYSEEFNGLAPFLHLYNNFCNYKLILTHQRWLLPWVCGLTALLHEFPAPWPLAIILIRQCCRNWVQLRKEKGLRRNLLAFLMLEGKNWHSEVVFIKNVTRNLIKDMYKIIMQLRKKNKECTVVSQNLLQIRTVTVDTPPLVSPMLRRDSCTSPDFGDRDCSRPALYTCFVLFEEVSEQSVPSYLVCDKTVPVSQGRWLTD